MNQDHDRSTAGKLSLDAALELLANRQRRVVLEWFLDSEKDHASLDEIISEVVSRETEVTGERPDHDAVASTLFHVHLPKFADAGVIEYDTRNFEVRYHGDPRIEELYEAIRKVE